jgi:hypothetical protein
MRPICRLNEKNSSCVEGFNKGLPRPYKILIKGLGKDMLKALQAYVVFQENKNRAFQRWMKKYFLIACTIKFDRLCYQI